MNWKVSFTFCFHCHFHQYDFLEKPIQKHQKTLIAPGDRELRLRTFYQTKLGHHYLSVMPFQHVCVCVHALTHQLKLPAPIVGVLYARVCPQGLNGGQVLQENRCLKLPTGHLGWAGVERHQVVAVRLVVFITPRNVQLLTGVHQHTYTWKRKSDGNLIVERGSEKGRWNKSNPTPVSFGGLLCLKK